MLGELFAEDKADAKEHFAGWTVFKAESGKAQVFDYTFVHEVNNFAGLFHISGQAVGVPADNAIVLAGNNIIEQFAELGSNIGLFGRAVLFNNVGFAKRDIIRLYDALKAIGDLVGFGLFLPALVGGAFPGIQSVMQVLRFESFVYGLRGQLYKG